MVTYFFTAIDVNNSFNKELDYHFDDFLYRNFVNAESSALFFYDVMFQRKKNEVFFHALCNILTRCIFTTLILLIKNAI